MRVNVTPYGEIVAKARQLNRIIGNLGESKNSRNAAITRIGELERETGLTLRTS